MQKNKEYEFITLVLSLSKHGPIKQYLVDFPVMCMNVVIMKIACQM